MYFLVCIYWISFLSNVLWHMIINTVKASFCCVAWEFGPTYWLLLWKGSANIGLPVHVQWLTTGSPLWYMSLLRFFYLSVLDIFLYLMTIIFRFVGDAAKRKVLDWPTRLSICIGAASGKQCVFISMHPAWPFFYCDIELNNSVWFRNM
jgi:hypothetical protein